MNCYPTPNPTPSARLPTHPPLADSAIAAYPLFRKLLIANRGEIACRIIRSARALGIRTVAIYSDADQDAHFVKIADEAWHLGPSPAKESYLNHQRILHIAQLSGTQAIHPGYGFLSEDAAFAQACADAHLVFIGPPAPAIASMGSKSAAKTLMEYAGIPLLPGYHGEIQDSVLLKREADRIGYPLLIKASAGGGGRGMRIVHKACEFDTALVACQREALLSFGDSHVVLEKYLSSARHIEIQVFADAHGNTVHLFERDCSVQRRHQKIIEEAPALLLSDAVREALGKTACAATQAIGYIGAGTVEFIMDLNDDKFYFMEMNTRIQVEHPVTEMITGEDLVAWQLLIAAGYPIPKQQHQLTRTGHAIEVRIYAEDPEQQFLPSIGNLCHLQMPEQTDGVRVDSGFVQGDPISSFYDPLLAKLIVWGESRMIALARLDKALGECQIAGVHTNVSFLQKLINHSAFIKGQFNTQFITHYAAELLPASVQAIPQEHVALLALGDLLYTDRQEFSVWGQLRGWRLSGSEPIHLFYQDGAHEYVVSADRQETVWQMAVMISPLNSADFAKTRVPKPHATRVVQVQGTLTDKQVSARINGQRMIASLCCAGLQRWLFVHGAHYFLKLRESSTVDVSGGQAVNGAAVLQAPMPSRVVSLVAPIGSLIRKGEPLMILEAMKMEHSIVAPSDGTVQAFYFQVGSQVNEGEQLLDFKVQ